MEPCNRSGELAVDELRIRPLLLLSTTTTTTTSTTTTTTTSTTTTITATTTHLELSGALGTFFVFLTALLLFLFLWLYSRYCIQSQTAARTARGRRMLLQLQRQDIRHQSSPTGEPCPTEPALSTLLPAVAYSSVEGKGQECAICLSEYDAKDMVKVIPCCGHIFHQECIDRWLDSHDSCPVCRRTEILGSSDDANRKDNGLSLQR